MTPPPLTPPTSAQPEPLPAGPLTFASLSGRLGGAITAGQLTSEQVKQILKNNGIEGMKGLHSATNRWAAVSAELDAVLSV